MTYIIILNYNGWKDTIECLESLKCIQEDYKIVLIDNKSTDDSIDKYDNTLITYALLLSYHKKLGSSHIVEYFRQEILWLLLRNNFKSFLVSFVIRVKNKILRTFK